MNTQPASWTATLTKTAWTLLLAAIAVFIAWQLLKQLVVPLIVIVVLIAIIRFALGLYRRDRW